MKKLGATGEFPDGKIDKHDEGELKMAIYPRNGNVIVDFGKPVTWLGFTPAIARQMAASLLTHANQLDPHGLQ